MGSLMTKKVINKKIAVRPARPQKFQRRRKLCRRVSKHKHIVKIILIMAFLLPSFSKAKEVYTPNVRFKLNPNSTPAEKIAQKSQTKVNEKQEKQENESAKKEIKEKTEKTDSKEKEPTKKEDAKEKADIYLNFENVTLSSVVNYLAEQKKINIIPLKELDAINVTLTTRNPLTLDRAWNVLLTLLEMNNFTIIDVDNLYRIVPKIQNKQEPLPYYSSATGTEPEDLPDSDLVVRYTYFLRNIKAETVRNFLATMLEGDVQINKDLDACIITEKCFNIKAAMKIIKELDQGGLREAIKIVPLRYVNADEIVRLFNEQIIPRPQQQRTIRFIGPQQKKPSTYFSTDTKIFPEPRKNALILLGTKQNLDKIIDFVHKYLDIPLRAAKSRLHIKEIKYARAETLKPILANIIKPPEGAAKALMVGKYKFFEDVLIETDSSAGTGESGVIGGGNRLIIACNNDDWKRLEKIIDKLDKPQPQVAFEVMVVDVSIKTNSDLESQFKPQKNNLLGKATKMYMANMYDPYKTNDGNFSMDDPLIIQKTAGATLTLGRNSPSGEHLWAIVKAYLHKDNFNIITQPFVVTNNYKECIVDATETRQVKGELKTSVGTDPVREQRAQDAKTIVKLTPRVNLEGIVDLIIDIEISSFQETDQANPNTNDRKLTTRATMGTGEVLVLGGLTRSKLIENHYKTPILADIPLIGNLFRTKKKFKEKSNLYIFIRPSIIKPRFEGVPDEYTQLKLDYAKFQMLNVDTYAREKDPIQRWFFKPTKQTAKQKIADSRHGIFRPIDNYTYGIKQPKSVNIKRDPYYRVEEAIKKAKIGEKQEIKTKTNPNKKHVNTKRTLKKQQRLKSRTRQRRKLKRRK